MELKQQEYKRTGMGGDLFLTNLCSHLLWVYKSYWAGTYSSSSVGTGTLHACTSDMEENAAEEAAGWRTKGKSEVG